MTNRLFYEASYGRKIHRVTGAIQIYIVFAETSSDNISMDNPSYYLSSGFEAWDFIGSRDLDYFLGNAVKYLVRAGRKPGARAKDDLGKALHYIEKRIIAAENGYEHRSRHQHEAFGGLVRRDAFIEAHGLGGLRAKAIVLICAASTADRLIVAPLLREAALHIKTELDES